MEKPPILDFGKVRLRGTRHGPMFYMPHDVYIGKALDLYGEYAYIEGMAFEQLVKPGMNVIEVGANIGAHTVHLASLVTHQGRVLAFEPQRIPYYFLCGNLVTCGCPWVEAVNMGLSDHEGLMSLPPIDYNKEGNFGGISLQEVGPYGVQVATLDSFGLVACHFIKIDVEGMEYEVLCGGAETIKRCRPILYVENDRKEKSEQLIAKIHELDYEAWWHMPMLFNPDNFYERGVNIYGNVVSSNMLCLPKELATKTSVKGLRFIESPKDWVLG